MSGDAEPDGRTPSPADEPPASPGATTTLPVVTLLLSPAAPPTPTPPFHFDPIERDLFENVVLKIGRQVNKGGVNARDSLQQGRDCVWFKSKVVSRNHAEVWVKDGQVYLKDTGSSSGTFLNHMRLAPSGRESRPYPLKDNDVIQLGIDYQGRPEDIYKCVVMKVMITNRTLVQHKRKANVVMFRAALKALLNATNPYATTTIPPPTPTLTHQPASSGSHSPVDCCICLCPISPFQALFVAPCSHCYHYKCVQPLLNQGAMFLCPLCRQVANLAANVQEEEEEGGDETEGEILRRLGVGGSWVEVPDAALAEELQASAASADPGPAPAEAPEPGPSEPAAAAADSSDSDRERTGVHPDLVAQLEREEEAEVAASVLSQIRMAEEERPALRRSDTAGTGAHFSSPETDGDDEGDMMEGVEDAGVADGAGEEGEEAEGRVKATEREDEREGGGGAMEV
ncbi:hypothetical protein DFJ74DRAFT_654427 [Hyaloraphidium curvatum]|nr:hypothetical protein DFJ74DRAFT_654427 [Hyaloraphidium curvatum]